MHSINPAEINNLFDTWVPVYRVSLFSSLPNPVLVHPFVEMCNLMVKQGSSKLILLAKFEKCTEVCVSWICNNIFHISLSEIHSLSIFKVHIKLKDWWPPSVLGKPIKMPNHFVTTAITSLFEGSDFIQGFLITNVEECCIRPFVAVLT